MSDDTQPATGLRRLLNQVPRRSHDKRSGEERRTSWKYRHASRRFVAILCTIWGLYATGAWWKSEHDSCERATTNRAIIRVAIEVYRLSFDEPPLLSCDRLFPEH